MSDIIENEPRAKKISESSDSEFDGPQFKPVVTLPEVEVRTNEENEIVLLKIRAKLYRFDSGNDGAEWKERGTGELKMLQHNENYSVRIVMRRDKTLKVCANHFITPNLVLKPHSGSEKAFIYAVPVDFAEEKPKSECFALKFGTVDNANLFRSKFEEAKELLLKKCPLYNGECDRDSEEEIEEVEEEEDVSNGKDKLTEALSGLKVDSK